MSNFLHLCVMFTWGGGSNVVQPMYLWNLKFILHTALFVMMERK